MQDQNDRHLRGRVTPPKVDFLAEQIIVQTKYMPQDKPQGSFASFLNKLYITLVPKWTSRQVSTVLAMACVVFALSVSVITPRLETAPTNVGAQQAAEYAWDEFMAYEYEMMLAGI